MKIALVTDQHFGIRGDSQIFLDYQKKFYNDIFFPYLEKHNITEVIDLGDTFDRRKYINFNTLAAVKEFYFRRLDALGVNLHIIVGNHSTYFKNTNDVNSPDLLLGEFKNISIYSKPKTLTFNGVDKPFLLVPWINSENGEECMKSIKESKCPILMGHFELGNVKLKGNFEFSNGISQKDLKKFEFVLSGHYHHKIDKGNFKYLGSPQEFDWGDHGAKRGFHVLDTDTWDIEFIRNPYTLFQRVYWDDAEDAVVHVTPTDYKDKFIKIIVKNKSNPYTFDQWVEAIEKCGPYNVIIEENTNELSDEEVDIEKVEDTLTALRKYIDTNFSGNGQLLYLIQELYNESLSLQ